MIRTVIFRDQMYPYNLDDCVVLQRNTSTINIAFPFHEDTPNFRFSIAEAMTLRNALDEILNIKLLEVINK